MLVWRCGLDEKNFHNNFLCADFQSLRRQSEFPKGSEFPIYRCTGHGNKAKGTIWRERQALETFANWVQTCKKELSAKVQLGTTKHLRVFAERKTSNIPPMTKKMLFWGGKYPGVNTKRSFIFLFTPNKRHYVFHFFDLYLNLSLCLQPLEAGVIFPPTPYHCSAMTSFETLIDMH